MRWGLQGSYVTSCTCKTNQHWIVDGTMNDSNGACNGVSAFWIDEGSFDGFDLAGIGFAVYNFFPEKISSGRWDMGLVVDEEAGDDEALAIEQIFSGHSGGPFAAISFLVGEYLGLERAKVQFTDGNAPTTWVEGRSTYHFAPLTDSMGRPLPATHAMYPFAREFVVGTTSGEHYAFGIKFPASYGEYAKYEFTDETLALEAGLLGRR